MSSAEERQAELEQFARDHPLRNTSGPPARRYNVLSDQQSQAILMKVDDLLGDSEIAHNLGVSRQCVGQWWQKGHVKRELIRQKKRYNSETRPAHLTAMHELRDESVKVMKERIADTDTKTADITGIAKYASAEITTSEEHEIAEEEKVQSKEADDEAWNALTADEQDRWARRIGLGSKEPVFIDEAEVVDVEAIEDTVDGSGDTQEKSTS